MHCNPFIFNIWHDCVLLCVHVCVLIRVYMRCTPTYRHILLTCPLNKSKSTVPLTLEFRLGFSLSMAQSFAENADSFRNCVLLGDAQHFCFGFNRWYLHWHNWAQTDIIALEFWFTIFGFMGYLASRVWKTLFCNLWRIAIGWFELVGLNLASQYSSVLISSW